MTTSRSNSNKIVRRIIDALQVCGLLIYAFAAPHSIAISWVGISLVVLGWLVRAISERRLGIQRTPMDLPLLLFIAWTVISSLLSIEPRDSIPKLINVSTFLMFYLTQSMLTRKLAILVASVMIASAAAGVLWGAGELILGRGVIVKGLAADSPLRKTTALAEGDVVWRVNNHRVSSVDEINDAIKKTCTGCTLRLSVISRGEHVEWTSTLPYQRVDESNPSGITGGGRTHRFRASGWTRHYETFAEMLQIIAQFGFGFAIAFWKRSDQKNASSKNRGRAILATCGLMVVAAGIPLTAMRSTLGAFALGALVIGWRVAPHKTTEGHRRRGRRRVSLDRRRFRLAHASVRRAGASGFKRQPASASGYDRRSSRITSSGIWTWDGRDARTLERVGLSGPRHARCAFDANSDRVRPRVPGISFLAVADVQLLETRDSYGASNGANE